MTSLAAHETLPIAERRARAGAASRDLGIDTMRGIAILMVIGIHSLQQPLNAWQTAVDAALRPCVPIFLFVSGYLTALSGRVPLGKRLQATVIPYAIAFAAAYLYMALHNPAMDHRPTTAIARFVLAYVFVYYYVFVYIGCTIALWLIFAFTVSGPQRIALLLFAILFGLITGSYLDPLLFRSGLAESVVEEVRMRDIPFWLTFMALGALVAEFGIKSTLADLRMPLLGATITAYIIYTAVRLFGVGDAADYDSIAFFGYAALLCCLCFALGARSSLIASLGSGSYFIYLWHIFFVMLLRDHASFQALGAATASVVTYAAAATGSVVALILIRELAPPRLCRLLGA